MRARGQRPCEKEVSQRYWRWRVAANSTNLGSRNLAGVTLREALADRGWRYDDGRAGPPQSPGRVFSECYPYTTIVGANELGYVDERPRYKRKPRRMRIGGLPTVARSGVRWTDPAGSLAQARGPADVP